MKKLSITGTSKVLNFIYPNRIPIFDNRVKNSWNELFKNNLLLGKNKIEDYVIYYNGIHSWINNCKTEGRMITVNELERLLFKWNGGK